MLEYLNLMLFGCALPVFVFWVLFYKDLVRYKKTILIFCTIFFLSGYVWDYLAFSWGVWYLGADKFLGVWFAGLPLEEWLYVILVPLSFATYTIVAKEKIGRG